MIPIEKIKALTPGSKLYRVIESDYREPGEWELASVTIEKVSLKMVMIEEIRMNNIAFDWSSRKDHGWVIRHCSLSEKEAWEHCLNNCEANVKSSKEALNEARRLADIIRDKIVGMDIAEEGDG